LRWPIVYLFCFLVVWSAPANAGDELQRAQDLMKRMKFDQAMALVDGVLQNSHSQPEDLVGAYWIHGLCHSARGQLGQAILAFRKLLSIQPDFVMSGVSPKQAAPFYQAVAEAREKGQQPIRLSHKPPSSAAAKDPGPLTLLVNLEADPFRLVGTIRLKLRSGDAPPLNVESPADGPGQVIVQVPTNLRNRELDYWLEARTRHGGLVTSAGGPHSPFRLKPIQVGVAQAGPEPRSESGPGKPTGQGETGPEGDARVEPSGLGIGFEVELHACLRGNEIVGEQGGNSSDHWIDLGENPVVKGRMGLDRWGWGLRAGIRMADYHIAFLQLDHIREKWLVHVGDGASTTWSADFDSLRLVVGYRFAWPVLEWLEPFAEAALGAHLYVPRTLRLVDADSGDAILDVEVQPDHRFAIMVGLGIRFAFLERFYATASYLIDLPVGELTSSSFIVGGGATF
jgi:hypothetical protein